MTTDTERTRHSVLFPRQRRLGAHFTTVDNWRTPLRYHDTEQEYRALRETVGVVDLSHVGKLIVDGPACAEVLDRCLTNDVHRLITPGTTQYTLACDPDGGVITDLDLYRFGRDGFMMFPGSHGWLEFARRLDAEYGDRIRIGVNHDTHGILLVRGPRAVATLDRLGLPTGQDQLFFDVAPTERGQLFVRNVTGEDAVGYELIGDNDSVLRVWDALTDAGAVPCGLDAHETLRIEAGRPRHGHDITSSTTAIEARLGWAVGWHKTTFWGCDALRAQRSGGAARRLLGLRTLDGTVPDTNARVLADDLAVGRVTSATRSPRLGTGIALAMLDVTAPSGTTVEIETADGRTPAVVVTPPFVRDRATG